MEIPILLIVIGVIVGVVLGYIAKSRESAKEIKRRDGHIKELEQSSAQSDADKIKIAQLETTIAKDREVHEREINALKDAERRLTEQFENIGNKIFEDKSETFKKQSKEGLENILNPLKEDIKNFKDKFAETDKGFTGKFGELKSQIERISVQEQKLGAEAQNLAKALKGDSKQQGDWGELVLEKTLEMSGLREGREYKAQETVPGHESGRRILDVVVHLPDEKDIVIDSKVSLDDYTEYCSAETEEQRATSLKKHISSVERHIKELSEKNYQGSPGVHTLNFVMMFMPLEPAYILTVNEGKDVFRKALDKNVVLVCPSTLLAVLRTVHSLWQMEDRNANAREIAGEAGKLYDKFAGFVSYMDKLGSQLGTAAKTFEDAYKSLSTGKGNIVGKAERMKQLGARTTKSLPSRLVEDSADEEGRDTGKIEEKRLI